MPNLSPQRKKERTLEALIRRLESLARRRPVLIIFEDAHWSDPTSRELLDLTVERVRNLPVLLLVTFRPEFQPPWTGEPNVTMLVLNRLDLHSRTALVRQIAGGKTLPDDVVAQIVERTDGVPLFIEELTKSVLESGLLREEEGRYALDRSFYFRQTHAIDITEKISAGRSLLLATAWSDRQRAGGRLGPGSASAWRPA